MLPLSGAIRKVCCLLNRQDQQHRPPLAPLSLPVPKRPGGIFLSQGILKLRPAEFGPRPEIRDRYITLRIIVI